MEDRTQIRFSKPDIDGSPIPQLITLEQETPIEGQTTKEDGTSFIWHKWLCTNSQYFMASETLDSMLKIMPDKMGKPLKIEKVENPKGVEQKLEQIIHMLKEFQLVILHRAKAEEKLLF